MKLALNKKSMKQLAMNSKSLNDKMTPQVAGGVGPMHTELTCYQDCFVKEV
ncbi:hypothetical protein PRUB_a1767 [Pseudoalteromonas rubra]|uniref:Uncharacterized protein n=1 Tax=Pseudoalteromonas rubra TaxID=43658 RepID=A0A8T0CGE4_9GAMM|nr:hypothetical protein [Pseudoalteromonas rubra]KAF7788721.1 hypothetical protein PRUB_a1767 [Pseudoalteromonas rubra]